MRNDLKPVEKLINEHKEEEARKLLEQMLKVNAGDDEAWVWLASITRDREERKGYLEEALRYNPNNQLALKSLQKIGGSSVAQKNTVTTMGHVLSGWPLLLALVGGAIGGALGGVAYAINLSIYKSSLPSVVKIVLNIIIGVTAAVLWFFISLSIRQALAQ